MAGYLQVSSRQRNGKGKKKVSMEKIKSHSDLLVSFSKRRSGLFKKASELCTLTGSKIGVIVFSPGNKVYSFGHPSVHNIMNERFPDVPEIVWPRNDIVFNQRFNGRLMEIHRDIIVAEHNTWLSKAEMSMKVLRQWTAAIEAKEKEEMAGQVKIDDMGEEELLKMKAHLNDLKERMKRMKSDSFMPHQANTLHPVHGEIGNPGFLPMGEPGFKPVGYSVRN